MKKICIITGTRAEYGLLLPIINKLNKMPEIEVRVVVTGSHLSPQFGCTVVEIEKDNIRIDKKIDILLSSDSPCAVSKSMGLAMIGFGEYFEEKRPDLIIVLGDRYEIFSAVSAAAVAAIPVAHIHGGEVTEGAYDEFFRHSITKMSSLHFTSCKEYSKRVIQLGEQPWSVHNVGAIGIENIKTLELMTRAKLEESIGFKLDKPFGLITFHPVTLDKTNTEQQFKELLLVLDECKEMKFIITKANADDGGRIINKMIDEYVLENPEKAKAFTSLGQLRYLSAMKYCAMVIGNSSSGIIEAPTFKIPTINIGNRQKGRLLATSVIQCGPKREEILHAIKFSQSEEFINAIKNSNNPYENGNVSDKIISVIQNYLKTNNIEKAKKFYDLENEKKEC